MDWLKWHKYNVECARANEYELVPYLVEDKNAPVIVVCPGGGYNMVANFIEGKPVAEFFQSKGYNAFTLRYRTKQLAHYPAPVEDIAHALRDVRDIYRLSLDNYCLCGFSAGGHMCGVFGIKEYGYEKYNLPKPGLLMLIYPVISLEKEITHKNTRKWFAGENDPEALEVGNIHHHITPDYPKTFIWRGDKDRSVPPINSDLMIEELLKNKVNVKYIKYGKIGHGVGLGVKTIVENWPNEAIDFWKSK